MTVRIFRAVFLVATVTLLASLVFLFAILYGQLGSGVEDELKSTAVYIARGIALEGEDYLSGLSGKNRITWLAADGTVLFDSGVSASDMENHGDREEVIEALTGGAGSSIRHSATLNEHHIYYAQRLDDGTVLRISGAQHSFFTLLKQMLTPTVVLFFFAALLSGILASAIAKRIVKPINAIDLEKPGESKVYAELSPLLDRIRRQNRLIETQMEELRRRQAEFSAITENMGEGLLVADKRAELLSCNSAALSLLGAAKPEGRRNILVLDRSEEFRSAVRRALSGKHAEIFLQRSGHHLEIIANPVFHENEVAGAVLLILDTTEQHEREALRREFSANVSHELKTPLTAISGTAEILKNGLVRSDDVPHFADNIFKEAQRLISLVEDIMRLSRLDEESIPFEITQVDLLDAASSVLDRLKPSAKEKGISLSLSGESSTVSGSAQVLDEMLFNLCENAVKYNKESGHVSVTVGAENGAPFITVKDDGIGIPKEDQARIFERFFRVDKSHSREIGGTGLGLSIVKHAAAFHGASLSLKSELGEGTAITVTFPKETA
ncbi:MAG: PAS domain-containing protein [Clostridiales bacterium]|nr:PAS domain-containing protein [Clostridiales bacterium]